MVILHETKSCPFCGENTVQLIDTGGYRDPPSIHVKCSNCGTIGPGATIYTDTKLGEFTRKTYNENATNIKAIEYWNKRSNDEN